MHWPIDVVTEHLQNRFLNTISMSISGSCSPSQVTPKVSISPGLPVNV
ncbi:MAG TPA: hypothetical protein PKD72_01375 [Gemmatales bacterium]|nr:hypothetical protein [Gemmatales bacterium]